MIPASAQHDHMAISGQSAIVAGGSLVPGAQKGFATEEVLVELARVKGPDSSTDLDESRAAQLPASNPNASSINKTSQQLKLESWKLFVPFC